MFGGSENTSPIILKRIAPPKSSAQHKSRRLPEQTAARTAGKSMRQSFHGELYYQVQQLTE
jgi:hypothetical protein